MEAIIHFQWEIVSTLDQVKVIGYAQGKTNQCTQEYISAFPLNYFFLLFLM